MTPATARILLALCLFLAAALVLQPIPGGNLQRARDALDAVAPGHHWPSRRELETIGNALLLVPVAALLAYAFPGWQLRGILLLCIAGSVAVEVAQAALLPARHGTVRDVVLNSCGAVAGGLLARGRLRSRAHRIGIEVYRRLPRSTRFWLVRRSTPKFTLGVLVVVTRPDGRVLMVRQRYRSGWFLPGGTLRREESVAAAAVRELREELGLELAAPPTLHMAYEDIPKRWVTWYGSVAVDEPTARELSPRSPEIVELRWADPTDLTGVGAVVRAGIRIAGGPRGS